MWALIDNGIVKEVTEIDPEGRFHPDLNWVECPEGCSQGWVMKDDFICPPTPVVHKPTREEIEAARKIAYADPLLGSDRLFSEAGRMQLMGEEGWEEARDKGAERYREIQSEFPWPYDA